LRFLEENRVIRLRRELPPGRSKISNSVKGELFLSPPQPPEMLWGPHSPLIGMYYPSSPAIKRPRRKPNNSPVSITEVMLFSTQFPVKWAAEFEGYASVWNWHIR